MKAFSDLYWRLDATTSTNEKLAALRDYFSAAPPDDAACARHVLSGGKQSRAVSTGLLREWAAEAAGLPLWLVEECYAQVGDLAETLALVLPPPTATDAGDEGLAAMFRDTIERLRQEPEEGKHAIVKEIWRRLAARERIVWHKLLTGGCRVGVSRTLVARALADVAGVDPAVMAHRLMGIDLAEPGAYRRLVDRETGDRDARHPYPFFLAAPLENEPHELGTVADWQAEWKWDGARAQIVRRGRGDLGKGIVDEFLAAGPHGHVVAAADDLRAGAAPFPLRLPVGYGAEFMWLVLERCGEKEWIG
ncbi:MAG: hypothetical protein ACK48M_02235, partial [Planctomycetia bacterium]